MDNLSQARKIAAEIDEMKQNGQQLSQDIEKAQNEINDLLATLKHCQARINYWVEQDNKAPF